MNGLVGLGGTSGKIKELKWKKMFQREGTEGENWNSHFGNSLS